MKASTLLTEEKSTKLVPFAETSYGKSNPVEFEVFQEVWSQTGNVRQYVAVFRFGDDSFTVTGENLDEVLWRTAKMILTLLGGE